MIGRLRGNVLARDGNVLLVDVAGVGYEVEVTTVTLASAGAPDAPVELFTHLVARDDSMTLFGFRSLVERAVFRVLVKVNGVGPKVAMTVLGALPPAELARCVAERDTRLLTKVPGIGKKTAERIVIELEGRLDDLPVAAGATPIQTDREADDAVSALVALGWRATEARKVVESVHVDGESTEDLIRSALKRMAGHESPQPGSARGNPSQEKSPQPGSARGNPSQEKSSARGVPPASRSPDGSA
ncbi:MAG: Holliday junction branch migration protein RuvA [Gammaproteobacteria bacterium]|nr:Holliday junction branch migration protein RuvA [Gammaproteobacteria bacterium]